MKILVVSDEGIGNTIMATPVLKALHRMDVEDELTLGTRGPSLHIAKQAVKVIDVTKDKFDTHYDRVLCTCWHYYFIKRINKIECGYFDKIEYKLPDNINDHEIELNMRLVRKLGYKGPTPYPFCNKTCPKYFEIDKEKINIAFANGCIGHPWERKEWPHEFDFIRYLLKSKLDFKLYLVNGPREADKWNKWLEENKIENKKIVNLNGLLNIDEVGYVMYQCDITICNDTGPGHVAAAVGAKLLSLWGPSSLVKNKPLGKDVTILKNESLDCLHCQFTARWSPCKDWKCMSGLTPEIVYNKMCELLKI